MTFTMALNFIKNILLILFIIFGLLVAGVILQLPYGLKFLVVQTGSMEPGIGVGSILVTVPSRTLPAPAAVPRYTKGQVITFASPSGSKTLVSHRVTDIISDNGSFKYQTKGDANEAIDGTLVTEQDILGKGIFLIPYIGKLITFIKKPAGFLLMIIIPSIYIIFGEVFKIISEIKKSNTKLSISQNVALPSLLILLTGSFFAFNTHAYFSDQGQSTTNVFAASNLFPVSVTPSPSPIPIANHLVVNEILYDTSTAQNISGQGGSNRGEFVEIYNPTAAGVNVQNWTMTNGSIANIETLPNITIPSHGFLIVTGATEAEFRTKWPSTPIATVFALASNGTIGNGFDNASGNVVLKDNASTVIDQMSYGGDTSAFNPSAPDVATGHSLERDPDGIDTDTKNDFVDRTTPSPGT